MSEPMGGPIPPDRVCERTPGLVKLAYAAGHVGIAMVDRVMASWLLYFYLPSEGAPGGRLEGATALVSPRVFGAVSIVGRVIDSVADPLVSQWTDNSSSPRGRRWPFLLRGGLPLAACLVALFLPRLFDLSSAWNAVYLAVFLGLFFFFFTYYVCPYLALLTELSDSEDDRINLSTMLAVFMMLGTVAGLMVSPILIELWGFIGMAAAMALGAAVTFYIPVIGIRDERRYCRAAAAGVGVVESLRATLANKPYVIYLVGNITFWFGFNIITMGVPYYVTTLVGLEEKHVTPYLGMAMGMSALMFAPVNMLARRLGKRIIMIASLGIFAVILPLIFFIGWPGFPVPPRLLLGAIMVVAGLPLATLFAIPNAIVADVAYYEGKASGRMREAMYFGTQGFFLKVVLGFSTYVMTELFERFGYRSIAHSLGLRLSGPIAGFFALVGMIAFIIFPKDLPAAYGLDPGVAKPGAGEGQEQ